MQSTIHSVLAEAREQSRRLLRETPQPEEESDTSGRARQDTTDKMAHRNFRLDFDGILRERPQLTSGGLTVQYVGKGQTSLNAPAFMFSTGNREFCVPESQIVSVGKTGAINLRQKRTVDHYELVRTIGMGSGFQYIES